MVELTEAQVAALEKQQAPLQLVNPETGEVYVLLKKHVYDVTCDVVGAKGKPWNDPVDDGLNRKAQ